MGKAVTQHPAYTEKLTNRQLATAREKQARKASTLMTRLRKCAEGKIKMSSQEIRSAEVWLKKVWPDLSAVQITDSGNEFDGMDRQQLIDRVSGLITAHPELAVMTDMLTAVNLNRLVGDAKFEEIEDAEVSDPAMLDDWRKLDTDAG
jgi:hypothetical protein